jgi:queuine tRNA-ribosyltransferase
MSRLSFTLQAQAQNSEARAASFTTLHGQVDTPIFMPVGTQATVKSQTCETLKNSGSRVLLANTYHLMLRPGQAVFDAIGGIHRFMNWDGPVLTDSGGFQIFSLAHARQIDEEGAHFTSYVDGSIKLLSPETSISMQKSIGSDIMMVLDQCIPADSDFKSAHTAMQLTSRWARRSLQARGDSAQALFAIVQGGCYQQLRTQSAQELCSMDFDGYAIGGLAVGESQEQRNEFTYHSCQQVPTQKPRYLMGVGTPLDILEAVHRGVDMFDCILPLEFAQRGAAFSSRGKIQLRRSVHKFADQALDPVCSCPCCTHYSRAYLHHLVKSDEVLAWSLIGQHNLWYYHALMKEMRHAILTHTWTEFYKQKRSILDNDDLDNPPGVKSRKPRIERSKRLGDYEIYKSSHGDWFSVRQISSGETMHSVCNPCIEAKELYINQTRLLERLEQKMQDPLIIWDLGLGAACNAMAVISTVENCAIQNRSSLQLHSFDCDLDPLHLATRHAGRFPYLHHPGPSTLLKKSHWHSEGIDWILHFGNFWDLYSECPIPQLIFFDFFSSKVSPSLWTWSNFKALHTYISYKSSTTCSDYPCMLISYTASTAVRSALLFAGWWVGPGCATGSKSSTTVAYLNRPASQWPLLGEDWLHRRRKSHARYPETQGLESNEQISHELWDTTIENHEQFSTYSFAER